MKPNNFSGILSANVGQEYTEKYLKIHEFYNNKDPFKYVPKKQIIKQLIETEYNRLFEK